MTYQEFLQTKIEIATESGFNIEPSQLNKALMPPHQRAGVAWALWGGRRAIFESFGLGKTMQELCHMAAGHENGQALFVLPLEVMQEYTRDAVSLLGYEPPTLFDFIGGGDTND